MNSKTLGTLAVAVLVLLAGCSIPSFGGTDTQTPTTETPDTPTTEDSYPQGVTADGINAENLSSSHYSALTSEQSFTIKQSRTITTTNNGSTNKFTSNSTTKVELSSNGTEYLRVVTSGPEAGITQTSSAYANASMESEFVKQDSENTTVYSKRERQSNSFIIGLPLIQSFLSAGDYTVEQTEDGVRISASNITGDNIATSLGFDGIQSGNFTAVVSDDGYIKSYEYSITSQSGSEIQRTVEYTNLGDTTVSEPDWLGTAKKNAAVGSLAIEQGNDYAVFSYENGVTLDQGTTLIVTRGAELQQAQLSTQLEPGTEYYVYFADGQLTFSQVKPGNPDDLATDGRLSLLFFKDGATYLQVGAQLPDEPNNSGSGTSGSGTSTDSEN